MDTRRIRRRSIDVRDCNDRCVTGFVRSWTPARACGRCLDLRAADLLRRIHKLGLACHPTFSSTHSTFAASPLCSSDVLISRSSQQVSCPLSLKASSRIQRKVIELDLKKMSSTQTVMKAVVWKGPFEVDIQSVPKPKVINPNDIVVKVTTTAICGSDLHMVSDSI